MFNTVHYDVRQYRRLKFYTVCFDQLLATRKWHCPVLAIYST